jgi:TRAP-type C4-dicarboxylate transport system permease small subunit
LGVEGAAQRAASHESQRASGADQGAEVRLVEKIVTGAANALAVAGLAILLVLAVFTLFDGLLRAVANYPLDLVREVGDLVAAICGACCLPIALLYRNNITLRIFEKILPPNGTRVIDVFASFLVELVMIGMAWEFYFFSVKTMRANDVTWLLNVPKAPFWFIVDAVLWVAVLVQAFVLVQDIAGRRTQPQETAL